MSNIHHRDQFPTGLEKDEFVSLTVAEFIEAYDLLCAGVMGELPPDPDFPSVHQDAHTGQAEPMEDTTFNRAWHAAGKLFEDPTRRVSFYSRASTVMPIALGQKYAKYVKEEAGSLHIALLATVAAMRFSQRTTKKALRAAFDAEFRRRLADSVLDAHDRRH